MPPFIVYVDPAAALNIRTDIPGWNMFWITLDGMFVEQEGIM